MVILISQSVVGVLYEQGFGYNIMLFFKLGQWTVCGRRA